MLSNFINKVETWPSINCLGVEIDDQLHLNVHIEKAYKSD